MFDLSQHAADVAFGWFNFALIVGAAIVLIGTIGVIWTSSIRERYADERISNNELKTAQALDGAARANLEAQILKAKLAWRRLAREQRDVLVRELSGQSFEVWTAYIHDDPESTIFRNDIDAALKAAGLQTKFYSGISASAVGLFITKVPGEEFDALSSAFNKAGLPFRTIPPQQAMMRQLAIVIGSKPPAF